MRIKCFTSMGRLNLLDGKQNVLTGATHIKISKRCALLILLDKTGLYYAKWAWLFCFVVVFGSTMHLEFVQLACLIMEYL